MRVGLLRDECGESFGSIAHRLALSPSTPRRQLRLHGECLEDPAYNQTYVRLVAKALEGLHGAIGHLLRRNVGNREGVIGISTP